MPTTTEGTEVPNLRDETLEMIVWYDPEELGLLPFEEREHCDAEIDHFQRTIHDYNGAQPIVIDDECNIVTGRGRVEASLLLGIDEIPALTLSSLTADDVDHYIKTLVSFGKYVGWPRQMLGIELQLLLKIDVLVKAAMDDAASNFQ